jgi:hypothetical protein
LGAQSFWNDEGNSARLSERTVGLIIEGTASDIHPPGYYLLLHVWRACWGHSEVALRGFSAAAGIAAVFFTDLLGRRLFSVPVGLLAAFVGAVSPLAVYYAQEARMYAMLEALSVASTYLLVRVLAVFQALAASDRHSGVWENVRTAISAVAYVLTTAAGLYTQYAFAFVLLTHNVILIVWWLGVLRGRAARWLAVWAGVQVVIILLYLPWLSIAFRSITGWPAAEQPYELIPALLNMMRWLVVGRTLPLEEAGVALGGVGTLLLVGLWPRPRERWPNVAWLALSLLLPVGLIFGLDLYKESWLKFLIVVLPAFHILIACGIDVLACWTSRWVQPPVSEGIRALNWRLLIVVPLIAFVTLVSLPSLRNLYFDPTYARDDYRAIAADVAAVADASTAVILNAPNQWEVFTYYYPDRDVYPAPYHPDPDRVETFLAPLITQYEQLFVVYWGDAESDPQRRIEGWLAAHAYKADDRWYGRVRLAMYGAAPLPMAPTRAFDTDFGCAEGASVRLRGWHLGDGPFAPGDILPITLFWDAPTPTAEPYKVTVQLLGVGGTPVAQHDSEPGAGFAPTTLWQPGAPVIDRHGVALPADLPPDDYELIVAVYHALSGARLPVAAGDGAASDHLTLTPITISASPQVFDHP